MCSQGLHCPPPATGAGLSPFMNSSAELQPQPLTRFSYCQLLSKWCVSFLSGVDSEVLSQNMSSSQPTVAARKKGHGRHLSSFAQTHPVSGILLTTLREGGCSPLGISEIKVCKWVPTQLIPYNYLLHNITLYCITLCILYNHNNYIIVSTGPQYGLMVKSWNQKWDLNLTLSAICDLLQVAKLWENNLFLSVLINGDKNVLYLIQLFCGLNDIIHIKCWVLNSRTWMTIITRMHIHD